MQSPAAMFIEAAVDQLRKLDDQHRHSQENELVEAMADPELEKLGAAVPMSPEFIKGYNLGLETMRVMIALTPNPTKL